VAERLGISLRSYQRYEKRSVRRRFNPTLASLLSVAKVLDLDICDLVRTPTDDEARALEDTSMPRERVFRRE